MCLSTKVRLLLQRFNRDCAAKKVLECAMKITDDILNLCESKASL